MTEEDLLAAIRKDPASDDLRLAYADWLDHHAKNEIIPCPVCTRYAKDPCPQCDGAGCYNEMGPNTFPVTCRTCEGTKKFPRGYHPERDVASGRHEGGWTNCKACNGGGKRSPGPGFAYRSDLRSERATFIRQQIEVHQGMGELCAVCQERWRGELREGSCCSCAIPASGAAVRASLRESSQRVFRLLNAHVKAWFPLWPTRLHGTGDGGRLTYFDAGHQAFVRRGFLAEVHAPLEVMQRHLVELCQHPLERLVISDRKPFRSLSNRDGSGGQAACWRQDDGGWAMGDPAEDVCLLPGSLFGQIRHGCTRDVSSVAAWFASEADALEAMSQALLSLGRRGLTW